VKLNVATTAQTLTVEEQNKIMEVVGKDFGIKKDSQPEIRNVDPFIGKELRNNALKAALVAALLIIVYVGIRFRVMSGISAGVMGVLALFHDVLLMLAVYTVFDIPMNESFIAAVLTILGYSMNDTIIIYDRIRENSSMLRKMPIAELVNRSIIQTLNRSINTVLTVLISILTIYIFAYVNKIHSVTEFTFPLLVGIASGCYSSIFIASPFYVMWKEHKAKKAAAPKSAKA
jgi:preprotein translocase subunit SecF